MNKIKNNMKLENVTLCAVSSIEIEKTIKALKYSFL